MKELFFLVEKYIKEFVHYANEHDFKIDLSGCSLGNLIFAGVFINKDKDFNNSNEIMEIFQSKLMPIYVMFHVVKIAILLDLKKNGDFLYDEALMVEKQDHSRMKGIFLLKEEPDQGFISKNFKIKFK